MDVDLIGYVVGAVDESERRAIAERLAADAELRRRADRLEQALRPLASDAESPAPPPGLAARTMAYIESCAPRPTVRRVRRIEGVGAFLRRRLDLAVAASIAVCVIGLLFPLIYRIKTTHDRLICQADMQEIFRGLDAYRSQHGRFPSVADVAPAPRNVAGMVIPKLIADGYLGSDFQIRCPSSEVSLPVSYEQALAMNLPDFYRNASRLTPCFGYSLGYRDGNGQLHPPGVENGEVSASLVALLADCGPRDAGNSLNHGGTGQNVLFVDGSCRFVTSRRAGLWGDDMYLNDRQLVGAGTCPEDIVIADGLARP